MADHPIIFSGPMARALLDGHKTMTRRLATSPLRKVRPGDRLWVRENFSGPHDLRHLKPCDWCGPWWYWADGNPEDGDWTKPRPSIHMPRLASRLTLIVTAVKVERLQEITENDAQAEGVTRIGADMPWAKGSFTDGPNFYTINMGGGSLNQPTAAGTFALLWQVLHGEDSWESNPEVVAISFRVIRANIDEPEAIAA